MSSQLASLPDADLYQREQLRNEDMATRLAPPPADAGYDEDFALWSAGQAAHLRAGDWNAIDIENIAEEIESLGKRDRIEVQNRLDDVIAHLLKLAFSRDVGPRRGWWSTVRKQQSRIERVLEDSPSTRRRMDEFFVKVWPHAVELARDGLRVDEGHLIPDETPFTVEQMMTIRNDEQLSEVIPGR